MSNTELWDKLGKTDPAHTKTFKRAGGFSGTAIKPMFSYRRMTEEFGPCGVGWGVGEPSFQVVPAGEEILVFCTVSVWHGDPSRIVYGVGGDKVVVKQSSGSRSDDEAFKKAFTDAVTNGLKLIGVGADVHMGMFDDSKYVNAMTQEFSPSGAGNQNAGQTKASAADQKRQLEEIEKDLLDAHTEADVKKLVDVWGAIAERDGWSRDYWDEAMRRFKRKRDSVREAA